MRSDFDSTLNEILVEGVLVSLRAAAKEFFVMVGG